MDRLNFLPPHFLIQTCYRGSRRKVEIRNKQQTENVIRRLREESDPLPCPLPHSCTSAVLSTTEKEKVLFERLLSMETHQRKYARALPYSQEVLRLPRLSSLKNSIHMSKSLATYYLPLSLHGCRGDLRKPFSELVPMLGKCLAHALSCLGGHRPGKSQ